MKGWEPRSTDCLRLAMSEEADGRGAGTIDKLENGGENVDDGDGSVGGISVS